MKRTGLTLIELLVAIAIMVIIVLAVAQLFQQSTVAWESGYRRTRTAMVGRAIVGYVAEDVGVAVWDGAGMSAPGMSFWIVDGTNGLQQITYAGGADIKRSSMGDGVPLYESTPKRLEVEDFTIANTAANCVDVSLNVKATDKGREETRTFTRRVYLVNRNRYYYD